MHTATVGEQLSESFGRVEDGNAPICRRGKLSWRQGKPFDSEQLDNLPDGSAPVFAPPYSMRGPLQSVAVRLTVSF